MEQLKATILLVDDEAALTRLMQAYLTKMGYLVDTSFHAAEALDLFAREPNRYQLLVTDLTLPDLPGQDLALRLMAQDPRLRVLLCSGYPVTIESFPASVQNRVSSLQKPFLPNMLAQSIEDLLKRTID
jgi:DNA-binding NtrC family response regulator